MSNCPAPTRRCGHCKNTYPATEEFFGIRRRKDRDPNKIYISSWCKFCCRKNSRSYHTRRIAVDPEYKRMLSEATKAWGKANPERLRELKRKEQADRRARKRNAIERHTLEDEKTQLKAQKHLCWWCGVKLRKWEIDHRVPLAKGGTDGPGNICISCPKCNRRKHAQMPWEFNGRLL